MPLNQTAIDALLQTRKFYEFPTEIDDNLLIGYSYNLDINVLSIANDIIEDYFTVGISQHKAELLLKLESYRYENQLAAAYEWFSEADDVTKFITIALVFEFKSLGKLQSHKKLLTYLAESKYGDAVYYLTKLKVSSKIITILKTGKFR